MEIFKAGILILLLIVVSALILYFIRRPKERYVAVESLLTPAELKFYRTLKEVSEDLVIFAKVRVADILNVDSKKAKGSYLKFFNRIARKHVDFLLCDPDTLKPVVAIELDDRSHERSERVERDRFLDRAFKMANLPLIRVKVRAKYDKNEIKELIRNAG